MRMLLVLSIAAAVLYVGCGQTLPAADQTATAIASPPASPSEQAPATPTPRILNIPPPSWREVSSPLAPGDDGQFTVDLLESRLWKLEPPTGFDPAWGAHIIQWTRDGRAVVSVGHVKGDSKLFLGIPGQPFERLAYAPLGTHAVLSPSRSEIAIADGTRVIVRSFPDGDVLASFEAVGLVPAWSPDGEFITTETWASYRETTIARWRDGDVTTMSGGPVTWSRSGEIYAWADAADGAADAPPPRLRITSPLDGASRTIAFDKSLTLDAPVWSPNDQFIAIGYYDGASSGFYIVDVPKERLIARVEGGAFAGWSDATTVHFIGDVCGDPGVYRLDVIPLIPVRRGVGDSSAVPVPLGQDFAGSLYVHGGTLAYLLKPDVHTPGGTSIMVMNAANGEARTLVEGRMLMLLARQGTIDPWSPDGRYLAFSEIGDAYVHASCQDYRPQPLRVLPLP